ncbi:HMG box-containing protein 1-like [Homarus americanus]|uniref:HMG box-containing protein 1 n=2 Tax=Homarus americanus TaxID=6706 RepID=A0A8J5MTP8_HOMAM|nr:HMG box-containing protein 1-like [Homarus americanus]
MMHLSKTMNINMAEEERMSPDLMGSMGSDPHQSSHSPSPEEPRDLSIKRKMRPVPPPLDLSKRNLEPEAMIPEFAAITTTSPKSPLTQKNLPLRKRAHSWSFQLEAQGLQLPATATQGVIRSTAEVREPSTGIPSSSSSSSSSSLRIPGLPTPHTPHTPHPHSAIPVITSRFPFSEGNSNGSSFGTGDMSGGTQGPLNLSTAAIGGLPSSLLSPAPSHPSTSSLNSSREELENEGMIADCHVSYSHVPSPHMPSPHHVSPHLPSPHLQGGPMGPQGLSGLGHSDRLGPGSSPCPSSISPQPTSGHQWPTNVWSVFMSGVRVHFVLGGGGQVTGARLSEELGQLERTHQQRYAPHGLHLMRILHEGSSSHMSGPPSYCQLYFRPVMVQQEDIMVITPPDHPFYVHGKGWCSVFPERTSERYSLPCQQLQEGDVCLPPYHPETTQTPIPVVTPDLADAMKRFDFNDDPVEGGPGAYSAPPSATFPPHTHRTVFLSPPASPSKKSRDVRGTGGAIGGAEGGGNRARRPMNGFMLFAKHHRLRLIQQYPGKDNRAISVVLGTMWKSLPEEDREKFNAEARAQAEERKRIDPDCWKRKRSHSTS